LSPPPAPLPFPPLLNPTLELGLTGLGNDNFSSAIDSVDNDEAGLIGFGGNLEGEPAEAFQAGLGLIDDFGCAGVPTLGMVLDGVELELGEESEEDPAIKSLSTFVSASCS